MGEMRDQKKLVKMSRTNNFENQELKCNNNNKDLCVRKRREIEGGISKNSFDHYT